MEAITPSMTDRTRHTPSRRQMTGVIVDESFSRFAVAACGAPEGDWVPSTGNSQSATGAGVFGRQVWFRKLAAGIAARGQAIRESWMHAFSVVEKYAGLTVLCAARRTLPSSISMLGRDVCLATCLHALPALARSACVSRSPLLQR